MQRLRYLRGLPPGGAIWMNHFTTPQIVAQIDAFLLGGEQ